MCAFSYSGSKRENKRERGTIYKYTVLKAKSLNYIEYNYDPTVSAVSVLLMAATVIIMVIVDRTLGIAALAK